MEAECHDGQVSGPLSVLGAMVDSICPHFLSPCMYTRRGDWGTKAENKQGFKTEGHLPPWSLTVPSLNVNFNGPMDIKASWGSSPLISPHRMLPPC